MRGADPRTAAKGHEVPHRPRPLPPLGAELVGVGAPEVRIPVHEVAVAVHDVALGAEDGRRAVLAAAGGEGGVSDARPHGLQADRVQPVSWGSKVFFM